MELFKLNSETVDMLSEKIGEMYTSNGCTKKETLRAKLLLEEALLKYRHRFGEDIELYFRSYRLFGQVRFVVRLRAPSFDPFTLEENPMAFMIQSIMSTFENGMPTWKYRNLENEIVFSIHKEAKIGNLAKIGIGIGAALILGFIAKLCFPAAGLSDFVTKYLQPLSDAYSGLFCVMAVLMTMFAITLSIVHVGDMSAAGALGGRLLKRLCGMSAVAVIILTLPILPFVNYTSSEEFSIAAKSIYDVIVGFIPTNIAIPFARFNSVQIMIIGAMFGFSLLVMGQKGETLTKAFDECNLVAIITNSFINKFISVYVALNIFIIVTTSNFEALGSAGIMVAAIVAAVILLLVGCTIWGMKRTKMKLGEFIKFLMPTFLVCISSANFGAAFSTIVDSLLEKKADEDVANLSINLGCVFFKPAATISVVFSCIFMSQIYLGGISVANIIVAIVMGIILVGAMPNIPGASVSVLTLIYTQIGLPSSALALMISINAILQFLTVAVDTCCLQIETLCFKTDAKIVKE